MLEIYSAYFVHTGWPICSVTALLTVYLSNAVTEHIGHPVALLCQRILALCPLTNYQLHPSAL